MEIFSPTLAQLKKHQGGIWIYIFWFIATQGEYKVIYLYDKDRIIHYSHLLPKFFKFPFMKACDIEIGPSWTDKNFRGKGIFPSVIQYIIENFKKEGRDFYILIHSTNKASLNAIQKTGFELCGTGYKTNKLGIYKVKKK